VTIHEVWRQKAGSGQLNPVRVPLRVIETQAAPSIAKDVAGTTNDQNRMKPEDFRSGDSLHERLQKEFNLLRPRWFYEYKRGTWITEFRSAQARMPYGLRRIQMKDLAQACLAFLGRPDDAIDRAASIFTSDDLYHHAFPTDP
jgi:hypothetical protein